MKDNTPKKSKMVYTPKEHIPVGVPQNSALGEIMVEFKHPKKNVYEMIPLSTLQAMYVLAAAESNN